MLSSLATWDLNFFFLSLSVLRTTPLKYCSRTVMWGSSSLEPWVNVSEIGKPTCTVNSTTTLRRHKCNEDHFFIKTYLQRPECPPLAAGRHSHWHSAPSLFLRQQNPLWLQGTQQCPSPWWWLLGKHSWLRGVQRRCWGHHSPAGWVFAWPRGGNT